MSITTYAELQTAVARWLHRDDLTTQIPDYISLAESRFWYGEQGSFPTKPLRVRAMQERILGSIADGAIAIPTGYLETINLRVSNGGTTYPLRYLPPQNFAEKEASPDSPSWYTMLDNEIKTAGVGSGSYIMDYYEKLDALSDTNTTNWLLTNAPNVYLFGACLEGALDIMSDAFAQRFGGRLLGAVNSLVSVEKSTMAGGSLAVMVGR